MSDLRDRWDEHVVRMAERVPGFWARNRLRAMFRLYGDRGYQFGYEIGGYGTVVGYCNNHKPHATEAEALECGRRFLSGEPEPIKQRMPWRRSNRRRP